MIQNFDKCGATYQEAKAAGYAITEAERPGKALKDLCNRLGPEYHLASIDSGNVVHRVLGDGWDVEVFPCGKKKYGIAIWKGYGTRLITSEVNIKDEGDRIACTVEMLLHLNVPADVYPTRYAICPRPNEAKAGSQ